MFSKFSKYVHLYILEIFKICSLVYSRLFQHLFTCMFSTFSTFVHLYLRDKLTVIASRLLILSFFCLLKFLGLGRLFTLLRFTFCVFAIYSLTFLDFFFLINFQCLSDLLSLFDFADFTPHLFPFPSLSLSLTSCPSHAHRISR